MHRTATLLTLPAVFALACSTGTPSWQEQETKNHPRKHVMVQFTDFSLHPSTAPLLEGGTVSWVTYASLHSGSVVFSDAVAAAYVEVRIGEGEPVFGVGRDGSLVVASLRAVLAALNRAARSGRLVVESAARAGGVRA